MEDIASLKESMKEKMLGTAEYAVSDKVYLYDPEATTIVHTNVFSNEYMLYLNKIDPNICSSVGYTRIVAMNLLRDVDGTVVPVALNSSTAAMSSGQGSQSTMSNMTSMANISSITSMNGIGLSSYPERLREGDEPYLSQNYDLLAGSYPESATDMVLVIDAKNRIDFNTLKNLGFKTSDIASVKFSDIVGTTFKIISNDDYYMQTKYGSYLPGQDYEAMYASKKSIAVRIAGIVRQKKDVKVGVLGSGIAYSDALSQLVVNDAQNSAVVAAQKLTDKNIMTMQDMDATTKSAFLSYLGGNATPFVVMVYPKNFEDKDAVTAYLDAYNAGKQVEDQVVYTDLAGTVTELTGGIMNAITLVLIAFAAISLIVSLIMIAIITYTSVLERTKEIGILRSLGARKKDITRVFDAETGILGVSSGILGVVIAGLLTIPINAYILKATGLSGVANLQVQHALLLVVVSTVLTILGGHVPALMASKMDPVEALRTE